MFLRIGRMRATDENFSVYPYVSILFNCSMYVIYMVHDHEKDTLIMVINAIGIGFEAIFICIALCFGTRRQKVINMMMLF
jgi:Sugar efflux transporter for intercellular exchange